MSEFLTYPKYITTSEWYTFYFRNCWFLNQTLPFPKYYNNETIKQKCSQIPVETRFHVFLWRNCFC
jgi:hypothetical protein